MEKVGFVHPHPSHTKGAFLPDRMYWFFCYGIFFMTDLGLLLYFMPLVTSTPSRARNATEPSEIRWHHRLLPLQLKSGQALCTTHRCKQANYFEIYDEESQQMIRLLMPAECKRVEKTYRHAYKIIGRLSSVLAPAALRLSSNLQIKPQISRTM